MKKILERKKEGRKKRKMKIKKEEEKRKIKGVELSGKKSGESRKKGGEK